jgi:hypothetical protein
MNILEAALQAFNKSRKAAAINIRSVNGFHYKNLTAVFIGRVKDIEAVKKQYRVTLLNGDKKFKVTAMANTALHVKPLPNGSYGELYLFINRKGMAFYSIYRQGDDDLPMSSRAAVCIY